MMSRGIGAARRVLLGSGNFRWLSSPATGNHRPAAAQSERMTDLGCRDIFGPDQDAFRETARKFMANEVMPHHASWEETGYADKSVWRKAGDCGLLGASIPAEHGGLGASFLESVVIMEEMAYCGAHAPAFFLHSDIIMPYLSKYGSDEQRQRYLPAMTAGRCVSAIAMTEPDAGSDLQGIKTVARRDGDDYILDGSKVFISNGWTCDVVLVVAVTDRQAKSAAHGISLFLVDADTPGFRKSWLMKKIGMRAFDTAGLFFDGVRLPKSALVGRENHGFYYLMNELPQERLTIGVHACAHAEFIYEETRNYVTQRRAYGKTLAALQTVQHKLAEMKTEICVTRAFVDQCVQLHLRGRLDTSMACMAKIWASELECRVASQAVQLHGGAGYLCDTPVARAFVDSRVQTIYGGSNEVLKDVIGRQIVAPAKKRA